MVTVLALISLFLALVVVLVIAWHLIGIYLALRKGRVHLAALAGGLTQIRDDTAPLSAKLGTVNAGCRRWRRRCLRSMPISPQSSRSPPANDARFARWKDALNVF